MNDYTIRAQEKHDIRFKYKGRVYALPAHIDNSGDMRWPLPGGVLHRNARTARAYIRSIGGEVINAN